MKSKTKSKLLIVCAILLVGIAIVGTIAYLTKTSGPVTNTFVAGDLFDGDEGEGFKVLEHQVVEGQLNTSTVTEDATGNYYYVTGTATKVGEKNTYTQASGTPTNANEVSNNKYAHVIPGTDLPKDPFISCKYKDEKTNAVVYPELQVDAYMYVEVKNNIPKDGEKDILTVTIDTNNWELLSGVEGPNKGAVYVAKKVGSTSLTSNKITAGTKIGETYIISGNKIGVSGTADISKLGSSAGLNFYGYLVQAPGFTSATDAFNKAILNK